MGMDYVDDECYYVSDYLNDSYLIKQIESAPIFKEFQKIMKSFGHCDSSQILSMRSPLYDLATLRK